ncbi:efflux transporter outer membrane subunit [Novosphingobium album (ex Hu et al. 2023)]|uniref:Efflux transporter outer membrane subunit n=1 Tax=Novosphingobium album (ex Hu et al. 2023) TaxID=2930093 RepID=A0ABT0B7E9_9SPHN|nr:efflux transporter outer membrane subunit [Novosphingobium album (ex Hu et al. 2023)]MCJ2180943.1 efflux transporter outer membrane subunit [Novosphingobium album (ex Hu et al. 2023)]
MAKNSVTNGAARCGRAALLVAFLLTSACAAIPDLGAKPEPGTARDFQSTASLSATPAQWPANGWWRAYGDPQLAAIMDEALAESPDLAAAAARMRTAQGYAQAAGAALKPAIDASASANEARLSQHSAMPAEVVPNGWNDSGSLSVGLNFDLDLWGKNRAAMRAARLDAKAAEYEFNEAHLILTTGIASTYAELAALYAQHDSLESVLDVREQSLELVRQRFDAGLDNTSVLKLAEARIPQTQADLAATDEAIALAKNALAALAGAGPDRALTITRPDISFLTPQGVPGDASIDLIGRRPDIAAARTRVEAAAQRIKVARASFYPDLSLSALAGLQSFGLDNLFKNQSQFGSVGPAITLPLFHGGALQGQYRGSRGQYDEAVALYNRQVVQALREAADAVTSQKMLGRRLARSQAALNDYEEALSLAQQRYRQGLSTYLDVLAAQESVVASRLKVTELQTRAFTLDVQLIRALGGGFRA